MTEDAAAIFEQHRPLLTKLAYRITGNWSDAEEMVAQAILRWSRTAVEGIENPRAFLTTVITRLALNHKASARVRLETPLDPGSAARLREEGTDDLGALADSLANAFEIVLSRLSPLERAVFLLREAFQMDYSEISSLLDESETNCRQILKRSRERIQSPRTRWQTGEGACELALERFLAASRDGEIDDLMSAVAPGVLFKRDGADVGLPPPPPTRGVESLFAHVHDYLVRNAGLSWSCLRIEERYELAALCDSSGEARCAFIGALDGEGRFQQVDHLTCPRRLSLLMNLVRLPR